MNAVDMVVNKLLYKKIDDTASVGVPLNKTFINSDTPASTLTEIGTFIFKVNGTARIYVRGYDNNGYVTLYTYLYDGDTLVATHSDTAPRTEYAETDWSQEIQAFKKYTIKAQLSSVSARINTASVSSRLIDNPDMYIV